MSLDAIFGSGPGSHHPILSAHKSFAFPCFYNTLRAPAFRILPPKTACSRSNAGANLGAKTNTGPQEPPTGDWSVVLTDAKIRAAAPRAKAWKLFDGGGLHLLIHPNGSRYWRLKYRIHGREGKLAFGVYPDVSLKEARARRDAAKLQLRDGIDPSVHKKITRDAAENTFKAVALEWLDRTENPQPNPKRPAKKPAASTMALKRRWLTEYVFPEIGNRPIDLIDAAEMLAALRRVEKRGFIETAHRAKSTCSRIFRYAIATKRCRHDPTQDLRGALASVAATRHAAIVEPRAVGELLRAIDGYQGQYVTKVALQLLPFVFLRSSELRWATWSEINFDAAEWRIPARRMKLKEMHVVPLATQAIALLRDLQPLTDTGPTSLLFRGLKPGRPISENTVNNALRLLGYSKEQMTGHGFRTIASTFLNEKGWHPDLIELQLAHAERDQVRGTYNLAQRLDDRRTMMQAWADHLDILRAGGNVIPMRSATS